MHMTITKFPFLRIFALRTLFDNLFPMIFLDPPPKVMAFIGNRVELKISRNQVTPINYESKRQPTFEVYWVGTPKGKQ